MGMTNLDDIMRFTTYKRIAKNVEEAYQIIKSSNLADGQPMTVPFYYYDSLDRENGHGKTKIKIALGIGGPDVSQPYIQTNITDDSIIEQIKTLFLTKEEYGTETLTIGRQTVDGVFDDASILINGVGTGTLNPIDHPELFVDASHIKSSATVYDVMNAMMSKRLGVEAKVPYIDASLRLVGDEPIVEGTILEAGKQIDTRYSFVYHDGRYVGLDGYNYDVSAGCTMDGQILLSVDGSVLRDSRYIMPDFKNEVTFSICGNYNESVVTPVNNFGEEISGIVIPRGTLEPVTINVYSKHKYYLGAFTDQAIQSAVGLSSLVMENFIQNLSTSKHGWIEKLENALTVLDKNTVYETMGYSAYIAVPAVIPLSKVCDSMFPTVSILGRSDITSKTMMIFDKAYIVYVIPSTSGNKIGLTNIIC